MDRRRTPVALAALLAVGVLIAVAASVLLPRGKATVAEADPEPQPEPQPAKVEPLSGPQLFAIHCAACHGERGDGNGLAARFLNPKPRDFGEAMFRLVTTSSNIATTDDVKRVIRRGMPGSAMLAFGHLADADVDALADEVRRLTRAGVEQRLRKVAAEAEEAVDEKELAETLTTLLTPGDPVAVPSPFPKPTPESVARGDKLYRSTAVACVSCHGETGKGDGVQEQRNNDGTPTRPRDFTRGVFKSGRDSGQLHARVLRGMPGTPMPSSPTLTQQQVTDLVHYILSLSPADSTEKVEHHRRLIVAKRVRGELPTEVADAAWQTAEAIPVVVAPLWWRDLDDPALRVAALHDGKSLAVRLTWRDAQANASAVRPDEFEDMAALQLYKGAVEPFVGMGAIDHTIDLWLWRAGWQADAGADSKLDDYPFDMPVYDSLRKDKSKELPDFRTARAAGNPNTQIDPKTGASSLGARGFGSTTFRPKTSQHVTAKAVWKDGVWTVVLRRPLAVAAGEGVTLAAGERCSAAFALWFGEARDRNGQKLVSVWQDLKIE